MALLASRAGSSKALTSTIQRRHGMVVLAQHPSTKPVKPAEQQARPAPVPQFLKPLLLSAVAAGLLVMGPADVHAAEYRSLADLTRETFSWVDRNKDGIITKDELLAISKEVAQEEEFDVPKDNVLDFTVKLWDLNQDSKLTTEEMLTTVALMNAVSDEAVDADAVKVFDRNGDGRVDLAEWRAPFGSLGDNGEQLKEYTFKRVDWLESRDGTLDMDELQTALTLMREVVIGY